MIWRRNCILAIAAVLLAVSSYSQSTNDCPYLRDAQKGWLRATNSKTGLCNQLFGVLSYVPVATLFNLNLIVGTMYNRNSFRDDFQHMVATIRPMPLSYFFDWNHFTSNTYSDPNAGIDIIVEEAEVDRHCGAGYTANHTLFIEKRFWPFENRDLMELVVKTNNVSLPRPRGSILQLGNDLVSTYQFRSMPDRRYAFRQLEGLAKLNSSLQLVYDAILASLPAHFFAVHLRLEHDVVSPHIAENNHTHFEGLVQQYLVRIRTYLQEKVPDPQTQSQLRTIYLSSGIFHSAGAKGEDSYRALAVVQAFQAAGYLPLWSSRAVSKEHMAGLEGLSSHHKHRGMLAREMLDQLGAEQRALVDLFVCKAADHFLPAQIGSSFGYVTSHWRAYERNISLREVDEAIGKAPGNIGLFFAWGFRK